MTLCYTSMYVCMYIFCRIPTLSELYDMIDDRLVSHRHFPDSHTTTLLRKDMERQIKLLAFRVL